MRSYKKNIRPFEQILKTYHALSVYDDRYIKTKIRTHGDKVYTNFGVLNVPKCDIECESLTVVSIDSLLVYESKYYLQVYLDNGSYKIEDRRAIDYLVDDTFETDED